MQKRKKKKYDLHKTELNRSIVSHAKEKFGELKDLILSLIKHADKSHNVKFALVVGLYTL